MAPKRLVLFVEGKGDVSAAYFLVKGLLSEFEYQDAVFLDQDPYRVHGLGHLAKADAAEWLRFLLSAVKTRKNLGGVLLLADGDLDRFRQEPFCPMKAGRYLSQRARAAGAGVKFSVASVIAMQEYETWLIAGIESLAGRLLPDDGRPGVKAGTKPPISDLEKAPRDAKKWLGKQMFSGYKPTTDQAPLTKLLVEDLAALRGRGLRSFRRLAKAVRELVEAIRTPGRTSLHLKNLLRPQRGQREWYRDHSRCPRSPLVRHLPYRSRAVFPNLLYPKVRQLTPSRLT